MQNTAKTSYNITQTLAGCGILLALSVVLSLIKTPLMPQGGSVTAASALPIILAGWRYGAKWGVLAGAALGIIGLMFDPTALKGVSLGVVVASIFLDYLLASGVLGLAGLLKRVRGGFVIGTAFTLVLKYVVHILSGVILWRAFAGDMNPWIYSIGYNATYMVPEILITTAVAVVLYAAKPLRERLL